MILSAADGTDLAKVLDFGLAKLREGPEAGNVTMAGAIVGLRVPGIEIDDIATTSKTLPEFPQLWAGMLAGE